MAPVTRSRVHKGDWANLPADLILAVARAVAANGGRPLAALQGTCAPWRVAVANEENTVWTVAAIADYPRISSIIGLSGTVNVPYRELYARQAQAEDRHITLSLERGPLSLFSFSDFIFTIEVEYEGVIAGSWTGKYTDAQQMDSADDSPARVWQVAPTWLHGLCNSRPACALGANGQYVGSAARRRWLRRASRCIVKMFVTHKMRTARLFMEAVTDSETDQEGILHVPSDGSPRHGRARSFMHLFADGRTGVGFNWDHAPDDDMDDTELRSYLTAVIEQMCAEAPA